MDESELTQEDVEEIAEEIDQKAAERFAEEYEAEKQESKGTQHWIVDKCRSFLDLNTVIRINIFLIFLIAVDYLTETTSQAAWIMAAVALWIILGSNKT